MKDCTIEIAFHIGAHFTDEDLMVRSLQRNAARLAEYGTLVPPPRTYRKNIRDYLRDAERGALTPPDPEEVIETLCEGTSPNRIVLSHFNFFCVPRWIFGKSIFYPQIEQRIKGVRQIFAGHDLSFFMATRNPAGFLGAAMAHEGAGNVESYLRMMDARDIRWSDVAKRVARSAPNVPVTIWCDEDSPILWGDLMQQIAGVEPHVPLDGMLDRIGPLLTPAARTELTDGWGGVAPENRQSLLADALDASPRDDALWDTPEVPGLTPHELQALASGYDGDIDRLARIDGVQLLLPAI